MKKVILASLLMALCIIVAALPALAEETPAESVTENVSWRGYTLNVVWLTTDSKDISIPNLRTDGLFVMVRFVPADGTISKDILDDTAYAELLIRLADGETVEGASIMFHTLIKPEGGGFPTIAEEQNNFDLLFFFKGKDETILEGAELLIVSEGQENVIPLNAINREKPEDVF